MGPTINNGREVSENFNTVISGRNKTKHQRDM